MDNNLSTNPDENQEDTDTVEMVWFLRLDIQKMQIRFRITENEPDMITVKTLKLDDMDRFHFMTVEQEDKESFLCVNCDNWLFGFCIRHPLLFVKEKVPDIMPYSVNDTFPNFLYLADSSIPLAGKGVFANIPLPSGLAFGPYSGLSSSTREAELSGYSWQVKNLAGERCWVDAKDRLYSNWMRYVNCPRFESEQNLIAILYNKNTGIFYYTYKPIAANQELLEPTKPGMTKQAAQRADSVCFLLVYATPVWYGKGYGMFLNIAGAEENGNRPTAPYR